MNKLDKLESIACHAIEEHLWMPPTTSPVLIKELIALVRLQHEALQLSRPSVWRDDEAVRSEAIEAYEQFNGE